MHKKYTRVYGTVTFRVDSCGCLIGANHDDQGKAVTITATVGAIASWAPTGARLTELQAIAAKET